MSELNNRVLLLDNTMLPIKAISWQRAITLLMLGKAEILESYNGFLRSSTVSMQIPAVVRLLNGFRRPKRSIKFSRINIFGRDGFRCQFCGVKFPMSELTFDHVLPRSQGGKTEWRNIVSACDICNRNKGNRTPEQAGMKLIKKPEVPTWTPVAAFNMVNNCPEEWRSYLYWTVEVNA